MHDPLDPTRPRLLYVEDDAQIADMTGEVLAETYDVDRFADGRSGLQAALQGRYDVMLIDRRLPGIDGVALVEAVRTARITTPVLMLTALGSTRERVDGLDAGANDYLVKPFEFEELLARLRALRRGFHAAGRRREVGDWVFVPDSWAMYGPDGTRAALTATETALLRLLTDSPEHVFTREEIVHGAFETAEGVGSVDTYVHYVRRKTAPGVIETVRGRGYRIGRPR